MEIPNKKIDLEPTSDENYYLEIYKIYIDRLNREGDWIWSRFRIYMTINTALIAAIGLIIRSVEFSDITSLLFNSIMILVVSIIGYSFSKEWSTVSTEGQYWESMMTHFVARIESKLDLDEVTLYQYIDDHEKPKWRGKRVPKYSAGHVTEQFISRKDNSFSNISVSSLFGRLFLFFSISCSLLSSYILIKFVI